MPEQKAKIPMSRASRGVWFLAFKRRPAADIRPEGWTPRAGGGVVIHYEDSTCQRFTRAYIEAAEECLKERDEQVSGASEVSDSVDEDQHPWLTTEALTWRPPIPPEYQKHYTWGDLKHLYCRLEHIRHEEAIAQEDEYHRLSEELMFASYSIMGFAPKPLGVRIRQMLAGLPRFGLLAWKEELWYQTVAWEYRQWKQHIMEKMKPEERVNLTFIEAVLDVLPFSLPRPPIPMSINRNLPMSWLDMREVDVVWGWLLLRGRHLSDWEFWLLCFETVDHRQ